jgi:hypothetical protein
LQLGLLRKYSVLWNLLLNKDDGCVHAPAAGGGGNYDRLEVVVGITTEDKQLILQIPYAENGTLLNGTYVNRS